METPSKTTPTPKSPTKAPGHAWRDKRENTREYNIKAKQRRAKAKHDAINRKKNQRLAKR